jgi:hypothetical protein
MKKKLDKTMKKYYYKSMKNKNLILVDHEKKKHFFGF